MATKVKNYWVNPENPDATKVTSIDFGYTEQNGTERKYRVEVLKGDRKSFHTFIWTLLDTKKASVLPWVKIGPLKSKVKITNLSAEAIQEELPLKIARRFFSLSN